MSITKEDVDHEVAWFNQSGACPVNSAVVDEQVAVYELLTDARTVATKLTEFLEQSKGTL